MLETLKKRFLENPARHPGLEWAQVQQRLTEAALRTLAGMEETGGQPDTIGLDGQGRLIFCDCSGETPAGRRSLCYDDAALAKRRANPPVGSAQAQAAALGVSLMPEDMYRRLQETGEYDLKTSSWIDTPPSIRSRGGALFCERRYGAVFTFHNGADSYYSVRGWRGYFVI